MIFTLEQWLALSPLLVTAATAVAVMMGIALLRHHQLNATLSVAGLNAALLVSSVIFFGPLLFPDAVPQVLPQTVTPLLKIDGFSVFYMGLILSATLATSTLAHPYLEGLEKFRGKPEEFYLLLSLSALGGLVLACSNHLAALFIGVELLSVPLLTAVFNFVAIYGGYFVGVIMFGMAEGSYMNGMTDAIEWSDVGSAGPTRAGRAASAASTASSPLKSYW